MGKSSQGFQQLVFSNRCDNGKCVANNTLCDGVNDCGDESDELHENCSKFVVSVRQAKTVFKLNSLGVGVKIADLTALSHYLRIFSFKVMNEGKFSQLHL